MAESAPLRALVDADLVPAAFLGAIQHGVGTSENAHRIGVGDDVLRCVATMIRTHCREGDVSARYGGDEFVVCLRGTTLEAAQGVMERLRRRVQANDWDAKCPGLAVTITVGLTQVRPDDDAASVLGRADAVLYRSKEAGRNQVGVD